MSGNNTIPIHQFIEHSALKPDLNAAVIERFISETMEYDFHGICIPPFWVKKVARELKGKGKAIVTVVGFPLGYQVTESKMTEIEVAIKHGATEIDLVMNVSAFKSEMNWVKIEFAKAATLCHRNEVFLKVIIETAYLSPEEIVLACKWCQDAGVDFVKTSTGFAHTGATVENIRLMRETLSSDIGIKASGGIKTLEQVRELIAAGADRIGTSSGLAIMGEVGLEG